MFSRQRWIDALFLIVEKLKGASTIVEQHNTRDLLVHLAGHSVSGYEVRLYCQRKFFLRVYHSRWVRDETYSTFRVFSVVSADAPLALRTACEMELDVPAIAPSYLSNDLQKETAIQAYLDILIERIRQDHISHAV